MGELRINPIPKSSRSSVYFFLIIGRVPCEHNGEYEDSNIATFNAKENRIVRCVV